MSVVIDTDGVLVRINVRTIDCVFSFTRSTGSVNDAKAVADVIGRAVSDLTADDNRRMFAERDRRILAERAVTALRRQVTMLKNRLAAKP